MDIEEVMKARHAVRRYLDRPLPAEVVSALEAEAEACRREGSVSLRLVTEESKAFGGMMAHYGSFRNVKNYLVLTGDGSEEADEALGYYGERMVLKAQALGLNSCWVAVTFSKSVCKKKGYVNPGEKLVCAIALGYGETAGVPHKTKPMEALCRFAGEMPEWFRRGMEAAMLAPTALNQQKFRMEGKENSVKAVKLSGAYTAVDLGIVKYHFEAGAGKENFRWI